jgi:protein-disulfide isomerase
VSKKGGRRRGSGAAKVATQGEIKIGPGLVFGLLLLSLVAGGLTWALLQRGGQVGAPAASRPAVDKANSSSDGATVDGPASAPAAAAPEAGTGFTPEGDPYIGAATAPVTIVEFSDYQCPNCRQFATEVMPWLRGAWLGQGFVRIVFRDFPIRGERSYAAAHAAHCAGEQGRYWSFHDRLFATAAGPEARAFDEPGLLMTAQEVGLDRGAFDACMASDRHRSRIEASEAFAHAQGFEGTPTYLINGRQTQGAIDIADWESLFRLYQDELAPAADATRP